MTRTYLWGGRVIDPATRTDGLRTVVIEGDRILDVREAPPSAEERAARARLRAGARLGPCRDRGGYMCP